MRDGDWWEWEGPCSGFSMVCAGLLVCAMGWSAVWVGVRLVKFCVFLINCGL